MIPCIMLSAGSWEALSHLPSPQVWEGEDAWGLETKTPWPSHILCHQQTEMWEPSGSKTQHILLTSASVCLRTAPTKHRFDVSFLPGIGFHRHFQELPKHGPSLVFRCTQILPVALWCTTGHFFRLWTSAVFSHPVTPFVFTASPNYVTFVGSILFLSW